MMTKYLMVEWRSNSTNPDCKEADRRLRDVFPKRKTFEMQWRQNAPKSLEGESMPNSSSLICFKVFHFATWFRQLKFPPLVSLLLFKRTTRRRCVLCKLKLEWFLLEVNRFDVREDGGARARKAGQAKEGCTYLINDADGFLEIGDTRPKGFFSFSREVILSKFSWSFPRPTPTCEEEGSWIMKTSISFSSP